MRRVILLFVLPLFITLSLAAENAASELPVSLPLNQDSRGWVQMRNENLNGQGLAEYMLKNQDPNHWTEVVTIQYFNSDQIDPKKLYSIFIDDLNKQVGAGKMTSKIIEEGDKNILAEWSVEGTGKDQYELIRFMGNGKTVAVIRYSVKEGSKDDKNMNLWKEIMKKAELK